MESAGPLPNPGTKAHPIIIDDRETADVQIFHTPTKTIIDLTGESRGVVVNKLMAIIFKQAKAGAAKRKAEAVETPADPDSVRPPPPPPEESEDTMDVEVVTRSSNGAPPLKKFKSDV